jgi:hypothetical protein
MGGVLPYGQEQEPRPTRPTAGQGPRGSPNQAVTTLTPGARYSVSCLWTLLELGTLIETHLPASSLQSRFIEFKNIQVQTHSVHSELWCRPQVARTHRELKGKDGRVGD